MHAQDELVVLVSGRMEFTLGDDPPLELAPGDELFIPAGLRHSTLNIGGDHAHWLYGYG